MGNTQTTSSLSLSRTQSFYSSKKSKKSNASTRKSGNDRETKNERLVRSNWCEATYKQEEKPIIKFFNPNALVTFKGGAAAMPFELFFESCKAIWASFPDQILTWDSIKEIRPGVVRVKNYKGYATHTGKPYSFGPYPPMPAKGAVVDEKPCHLIITLKRGKVVGFEINAYHGDVVGPPGYYRQIGGDLSAIPMQ